MMGAEWFRVSDDMFAHFETVEFQSTGEGQYVTVGNLTLAGKTVPVSIPFSLDIVEGKRAYVNAQFALKRLDFDLGAGQWKSDSDIGHQVVVNLRLVATNISDSAN